MNIFLPFVSLFHSGLLFSPRCCNGIQLRKARWLSLLIPVISNMRAHTMFGRQDGRSKSSSLVQSGFLWLIVARRGGKGESSSSSFRRSIKSHRRKYFSYCCAHNTHTHVRTYTRSRLRLFQNNGGWCKFRNWSRTVLNKKKEWIKIDFRRWPIKKKQVHYSIAACHFEHTQYIYLTKTGTREREMNHGE